MRGWGGVAIGLICFCHSLFTLFTFLSLWRWSSVYIQAAQVGPWYGNVQQESRSLEIEEKEGLKLCLQYFRPVCSCPDGFEGNPYDTCVKVTNRIVDQIENWYPHSSIYNVNPNNRCWNGQIKRFSSEPLTGWHEVQAQIIQLCRLWNQSARLLWEKLSQFLWKELWKIALLGKVTVNEKSIFMRSDMISDRNIWVLILTSLLHWNTCYARSVRKVGLQPTLQKSCFCTRSHNMEDYGGLW